MNTPVTVQFEGTSKSLQRVISGLIKRAEQTKPLEPGALLVFTYGEAYNVTICIVTTTRYCFAITESGLNFRIPLVGESNAAIVHVDASGDDWHFKLTHYGQFKVAFTNSKSPEKVLELITTFLITNNLSMLSYPSCFKTTTSQLHQWFLKLIETFI